MKSILLVVVLIALSSFAAWSAEENMLLLKPELQRGDIRNPQGFWPLLGVGLGVMDGDNRPRTGGVPMHLKLLGSYYFETIPWVADAGVGFHSHFLNEDGPGSDTIQSLYTELAARYKFTNRWQLGAIWNTLVDNPDRYASNTNNLASFVGVQLMKEFTWSDTYLVRAGGRAMTDVGISGGSVSTVMAELEVSFGPGHPRVVQVEESKPEVVRAVAPHLANRAIQTFQLEPGPVNFESDSTRPVRTSDAYLRRLARALADNRHLFDRVQVIGHADQRGPDRYNDRLSARRAQIIANTLVSSGLAKRQVHSEGRGELELASNSTTPGALMRNRRVQLEFQGVKNQEALKNIIEAVRR